MKFTTIVSTPNGQILPASQVLEVPNDTLDPVQIQTFHNRNGGNLGFRNQQWFVVRTSDDGLSLIVSRSTGKVLHVRGWNPVVLSSKPVFQDFRNQNVQLDQSWMLPPNYNGDSISVQSGLNRPNHLNPHPPPYALSVDPPMTDGAHISISQFNDGPGQRWTMVEQDIPVVAIASRQNPNSVLDVASFSHDDGETVRQNQYNGGPNQLWMIHALVDHPQFCRITAVHSDKVLQANSDGYLIQGVYNSDAQNQIWQQVQVNDSCLFLNRESGLALQASRNGVPLMVEPPNVTSLQEWSTIAVDQLYQNLNP
jgi:hypothetical protein